MATTPVAIVRLGPELCERLDRLAKSQRRSRSFVPTETFARARHLKHLQREARMARFRLRWASRARGWRCAPAWRRQACGASLPKLAPASLPEASSPVPLPAE